MDRKKCEVIGTSDLLQPTGLWEFETLHCKSLKMGVREWCKNKSDYSECKKYLLQD